MKPHSNTQTTGADLGGAPEILTGRPTVAANSGTEVSRALLKAFQAACDLPAEWVRLPAPRARDRMTGLSRTSLNEAIERGDVKAITVRQPGAVRGIKLVNVASLRSWLAKLDAEQNAAVKDGGQP